MRVQFIIQRESHDEHTYAVVEADAHPYSTDDRVFLQKLIDAVSEWGSNTADGRRAWRQSSQDFNVGDLAFYQHADSLQPYLKNHGITSLSIETFTQDYVSRCWNYDTVLMREPEEG